MDRDELIDRLKKYEWSDIEFRAAQRASIKAAYKTVSAFANTGGEWLVFGVRDENGKLEIVGVIEVENRSQVVRATWSLTESSPLPRTWSLITSSGRLPSTSGRSSTPAICRGAWLS